jgi:hypothetical protein
MLFRSGYVGLHLRSCDLSAQLRLRAAAGARRHLRPLWSRGQPAALEVTGLPVAGDDEKLDTPAVTPYAVLIESDN